MQKQIYSYQTLILSIKSVYYVSEKYINFIVDCSKLNEFFLEIV